MSFAEVELPRTLTLIGAISMLIYYVYAYIRENGTPYYIGKGKNKRAFSKHQSGVSVPKNKSRIIILESALTEIGALALERRLIKWWGRKDLGTGILVNKTDGGDGIFGLSDHSRKKMSEAKLGKPGTHNIPHSSETKKLISEKLKGKPSKNKGKVLSYQRRKQISESLLGKTLSDETKLKISSSLIGRKLEDKTKKKLSESAKNLPITECPYCHQHGKGNSMKRWHFENCKFKT